MNSTTLVQAQPSQLRSMEQAAGIAAKVQAAYTMAVARPRDADNFRVALLKECRRPGFAAAARWSKPQGGQRIEGWSIRFIEAAVRLFGNIQLDSEIVFEDDLQQVLECRAVDLETNTRWSSSITISKTVERKRTSPGQHVLSTRVGSSGQTLYTVAATTDEVQQKTASAVSKALRTLGKKLLPADVLEEAWAEVAKTMVGDGGDPEAAKKQLMDAFAGVGVTPANLVEYLGHPLGQVTPTELADLRSIFQTIRSGEARWADYVRTEEEETDEKESAKSKTNTMIEKIKGASK